MMGEGRVDSHTCTGHKIRKLTVNVTNNWLGLRLYTSLLAIHGGRVSNNAYITYILIL
jgi:hypothetical protein